MTKQYIAIVQIDQPFCTRTYGSAPCTAALGTTGDHKCHQSYKTCQDPANYVAGTLTLTFGYDQDDIAILYGPLIPSLEAVDHVAGRINLGGMEPSASAIGQREVVTLKFKNHKHSDLFVDKYRLERISGAAQDSAVGYNPYHKGSFWGKWLARNPYYVSYPLRIYEGFVGDALNDMYVSHYVIDRIDGPKRGIVTITAKDLFSKLEDRKATAPKASRGELQANITAVATSFVAIPSGIGAEYAASGYVNIGDEIIQYTRSVDTFTVVARGALNTVAEAHDAEDLIQQVLVYTSEQAHDIVYDLMVNYANIPSASIDKPTWDVDAVALPALYTTRIAKPVPVIDLISELSEQAGATWYPDISTGMIIFSPLVAKPFVKKLSDNKEIIKDSVNPTRNDAKRASRVLVYYAQINPVEDLDDPRNFRSRYVSPDLEAEGPNKYNAQSSRVIFSRWVPQFGRSLAAEIGARILTNFVDPPWDVDLEVKKEVANSLSLTDYVQLETVEIEDEIGDKELDRSYAVVSLQRHPFQPKLTLQQVRFAENDDGDREIYIENDVSDVVLRAIHDSLFAAPVSGDVVICYVNTDVVVGSSSSLTPSFDTGTWPAGVTITLINAGYIVGKGGNGGNGGSTFTTGSFPAVTYHAQAGVAGSAGGTAIKAQAPISIDNTNGHIWGGGGGGGGGGAAVRATEFTDGDFPPTVQTAAAAAGGSSGGSGAGVEAALAGVRGTSTHAAHFSQQHGNTGGVGDIDTGGTGGTGVSRSQNASFFGTASVTANAGAGGAGGGPGAAGSNGVAGSTAQNNGSSAGQTEAGNAAGALGAGGAAGKYAEGNSNITWIANGDRLGGVS